MLVHNETNTLEKLLKFLIKWKHEDDEIDPFLYEVYYDFKVNDAVSVTPAIFGGTSKNSAGAEVEMQGYVVNTTLKF